MNEHYEVTATLSSGHMLKSAAYDRFHDAERVAAEISELPCVRCVLVKRVARDSVSSWVCGKGERVVP